jgi:hypothetical protein
MHVDIAFKYYKKFLLEDFEKRKKIYLWLGFDLAGVVSFRDWEVFGAILVGDKAKGKKGSDLRKYEIKSALEGNSFEYQYHARTALDKFKEDCNVDHLFVSYQKDYRSFTVRLVNNTVFKSLTDGWLDKIMRSYYSDTRHVVKQRCRESITYNNVFNRGDVVFEVKNSNLVNHGEEIKMAQGLKI